MSMEKLKNDFIEDVRDSISYTCQGWRDLVQRILNNEIKILHSNIFERYQYQLINEYEIQENERIYEIHNLPLFCLPSRETTRSISIRTGSILRYSSINPQMAHSVIIPSLVPDLTDREPNKFSRQKRVTIIPSNNKLIEDDSSIDGRHSSSDDLHQILINTIHKNSYQDEPSLLNRKRHYDNHLSRLSLRSISYGFDLGIKHKKKKLQHENLSSSPIYRLPANKIELDKNQQEIIRRTGSLKKNF